MRDCTCNVLNKTVTTGPPAIHLFLQARSQKALVHLAQICWSTMQAQSWAAPDKTALTLMKTSQDNQPRGVLNTTPKTTSVSSVRETVRQWSGQYTMRIPILSPSPNRNQKRPGLGTILGADKLVTPPDKLVTPPPMQWPVKSHTNC